MSLHLTPHLSYYQSFEVRPSIAVDLLDAKLEDDSLDGRTETEGVCTILELMQDLGLEVCEQLDGYQGRHAR